MQRSLIYPIIALTPSIAAADIIQPTTTTDTYIAPDGRGYSALQIDISGYESIDLQGSTNNDVLDVFMSFGNMIVGVAWDVTLTTIGGSWASEASFSFENELSFTPGNDDAFPVTQGHYDSGGIIDFNDAGYDIINISSDGILEIEFFETFDDAQGMTDAIWQAGSTITLYTPIWPTPGPLSALALTALITTRRKRTT